jgi:hypothetical protein
VQRVPAKTGGFMYIDLSTSEVVSIQVALESQLRELRVLLTMTSSMETSVMLNGQISRLVKLVAKLERESQHG